MKLYMKYFIYWTAEKKGYCIECNMTVHVGTITGNAVMSLKICLKKIDAMKV